MNNTTQKASFQYTYSAKEQEEVISIRDKYLPKEENKMELLRKLDAQANNKATLYAIMIGVVGILILGLGMSMCMVWADHVFAAGILIGVIGMVVLALAYPVYNRILKKERERVAPEILRLTEELMK